MSVYSWGTTSKKNLEQAHIILQALADKALKISKQDLKVICSYRNEADQNKAFAEKIWDGKQYYPWNFSDFYKRKNKATY